jgi:nuclear pore complex protein Nup205
VTIDGQRVALNSDFVRLAIFLSQQLDCSERYVAGILYKVMSENPNITAADALEATVAEFHYRRRLLAESVLDLVEATRLGGEPDATPTSKRLSNFVQSELIHGLPAQGTETWALRIYRAVDTLDGVLAAANNARQSAGSITVLPSGSGQYQNSLSMQCITHPQAHPLWPITFFTHGMSH